MKMETRVTITIPQELYRRAERLAQVNNRPVADVLADSIVLQDETEVTTNGLLIPDSEIATLEAAAESQDEAAFVAAYKVIVWQAQPAEKFVRAIRLALAAGAHTAARNLAQEGIRQYPDDANLEKWSRLLAPPQVTVSKRSPDPGVTANRDWLKAHWQVYHHQWVALHNGKLLGAAANVDDLIQQVGDTKGTGILITKVY